MYVLTEDDLTARARAWVPHSCAVSPILRQAIVVVSELSLQYVLTLGLDIFFLYILFVQVSCICSIC